MNDLVNPLVEDRSQEFTNPFLKWAGGKRALLPRLLKLVPPSYNEYHEPFLGAGSVFFALKPERANLADTNAELINAFIVVRDEPYQLIKTLKRFRYNESQYYSLRKSKPKTSLSRAARFIFLNKTCWNGLYRVNKLGQFNVPFGRYNDPKICDASGILAASETLQKASICNGTFNTTLKKPKEHDFVYCDPPYTVAHDKNGFLAYNEKIFSWEDQVQLKQLIEKLTDRGCCAMVSNACHTSIKELYSGYKQIVVSRQSTIAGNKSARGSVKELVILNYDPVSGEMIW